MDRPSHLKSGKEARANALENRARYCDIETDRQITLLGL